MPDPGELLRSRRVEDRLRAVARLEGAGRPDRQALLLIALADRSHYVGAMAAEQLAASADGEGLAAMLERFEWCMADGPRRDPGCHIRARLAFGFGHLDYSLAAPALQAGLRVVQIEQVGMERRDTGAHLRANCALALGALRPPDIVRELALLLFDRHGRVGDERNPDPQSKVEVRRMAARALALTADPGASIHLAIRLAYPDDEAPEVLQECMQALVDLEDPQAANLLRPYLSAGDAQLATWAALAAARTRKPEAAAWIRDAALRFGGDALEAITLALATMRTPEAHAALEELLAFPKEAVRAAAVQALAQVLDEPTRLMLARTAEQDPSSAVRDAAARALRPS